MGWESLVPKRGRAFKPCSIHAKYNGFFSQGFQIEINKQKLARILTKQIFN